MGRPSSLNSCQTCRNRHLKCDGQLPICGQCQRSKSSRRCVRASSFQFRPVTSIPRAKSRIGKEGNSKRRRSDESSGTEGYPNAERFQIINETSAITEGYTINTATTEVHELQRVNKSAANDNSYTGGATDTENCSVQSGSEISAARDRNILASSPSTDVTTSIRTDRQSASNGFSHQENDDLVGGLFTVANTKPVWAQSMDHEIENPELPGSRDTIETSDSPSRTVNDIFSCPDFYINQTQQTPRLNVEPVEIQAREAHLVRVFIQFWGPLLDCTDPGRHFTTHVPLLALTRSPYLLYAMLSISALYLSRISNYPTGAANHYRRQCAAALIPVLRDHSSDVLEEAMFATYVLLRVYDHYTVTLKDRKPESLFSAALALSTMPWVTYLKEAEVKQAAFWVHMRQDIHVALILECPINVDFPLYIQTKAVVAEIIEQDRASLQNTYSALKTQQGYKARLECAWSNKVIGLMCYVVNYCFGDNEKTVEEWSTLLLKLERWNLEKPESFQPFFDQGRNVAQGRVLPEIYFTSDCHILGLIFYHMAMVLLKSHRPGASLKQKDMMKLSSTCKEEIVHHTRILAAIVTTNPITQALITVTPMLGVAAIYVDDEETRAAVLKVLDRAKECTGVPTHEVTERLKTAWDAFDITT